MELAQTLMESRVMRLFQKILCPVDFSESSVSVLHWGDRRAVQHGAQVVVLHVLDPYAQAEEDRAAALRRLQLLVAGMRTRPEVVLSTGDPANKIVSLAEGLGAGLVVIGCGGRGEATPLGRVAEGVLRGSAVPIVAVPCGWDAASPATGRAMMPLATLREAPRGFGRWKNVLREVQCVPTLMHVVDYHDAMLERPAAVGGVVETSEKELELQRLGRTIQQGDDPIGSIICLGDVVEEVAKEADSGNYDYLLMSIRKKTFLCGAQESTACRIISRAAVPVIALRVD